jgi:chromosome segregation protein
VRDREALAAAVAARQEAEQSLAAEQQRVAAAARAAADRREGLARLAGQVSARRSKVEAGEAEIGRLTPALEEAPERAARAQAEFTSIETQVAGLDAGEEDLDSDHEEAALRLAAADDRVAALRDEERAAEQERAALVARKDALELGLARKDGCRHLLAAATGSGVLGSVAALLTVEPATRPRSPPRSAAAADASSWPTSAPPRPPSGCSRTTTPAGSGCSSASRSPRAGTRRCPSAAPGGARPRSTW